MRGGERAFVRACVRACVRALCGARWLTVCASRVRSVGDGDGGRAERGDRRQAAAAAGAAEEDPLDPERLRRRGPAAGRRALVGRALAPAPLRGVGAGAGGRAGHRGRPAGGGRAAAGPDDRDQLRQPERAGGARHAHIERLKPAEEHQRGD